MTLTEFKDTAKARGYDEHPFVIFAGITELKDFIDYSKVDEEVKRHLAKVILCRNFSPAGGYRVLSDDKWFIKQFMIEFREDPLRPELTSSIREAMLMILDEDHFTKPPIGCSFLFGVLEYWTKNLLGWRPSLANHHDIDYHKPFKEMSLPIAINKLKKVNAPLSKILNEIDGQSVKRVKEVGIDKHRGVIPKMADRISEARNPMLHGERYNYSHMGSYLSMIYILFYLHHSEIQNDANQQ